MNMISLCSTIPTITRNTGKHTPSNPSWSQLRFEANGERTKTQTTFLSDLFQNGHGSLNDEHNVFFLHTSSSPPCSRPEQVSHSLPTRKGLAAGGAFSRDQARHAVRICLVVTRARELQISRRRIMNPQFPEETCPPLSRPWQPNNLSSLPRATTPSRTAHLLHHLLWPALLSLQVAKGRADTSHPGEHPPRSRPSPWQPSSHCQTVCEENRWLLSCDLSLLPVLCHQPYSPIVFMGSFCEIADGGCSMHPRFAQTYQLLVFTCSTWQWSIANQRKARGHVDRTTGWVKTVTGENWHSPRRKTQEQYMLQIHRGHDASAKTSPLCNQKKKPTTRMNITMPRTLR